MADQEDIAARATMAQHLDVHLGHQRTGCVEYFQAAFGSLAAHGLRNAMRAENDRATRRNFVEFLDENRAALAQVLDHETIVHDFMAHVDRGAQGFDRALHDYHWPVFNVADSCIVGGAVMMVLFSLRPADKDKIA